MEPKKLEPMPLDELRERLRFTAQSAVSTLEPVDVARMRLTIEALVAVFAEATRAGVPTWAHLKKVASEVVETKPEPTRCEGVDVASHYRASCRLLAGHDGPCDFKPAPVAHPPALPRCEATEPTDQFTLPRQCIRPSGHADSHVYGAP